MNLRKCIVAAFAAFVPSFAHATYIAPAWTRPTTAAESSATLSTYQHWDNFTSVTANAPDIAVVIPTGATAPTAGDVSATVPGHSAAATPSGAIVTSTGNLYAGSGYIIMRTTIPNFGRADATSTRFLLQLTTTANPLFVDKDEKWVANPVVGSPTPGNTNQEDNFSKLLVNGQRVDSAAFNFSNTPRTWAKGSSETSWTHERAISFELPGNASGYTLEWLAANTSTSMSAIAIDTQAVVMVPEPATAALLVVAGATLGLRRRRRRLA